MTHKSHGDGRRMTLAEAIERRARILRAWGGLLDGRKDIDEQPPQHAIAHRTQDGNAGALSHDHHRAWAAASCRVQRRISAGFTPFCNADAGRPEDVALLDGIPVAMCSACRAAQRSRPDTFDVETLEDLAGQFLDAVERLIGGSP